MLRNTDLLKLISTTFIVVAAMLVGKVAYATTTYSKIGEIYSGGGVSQMVWSPSNNTIIVRNGFGSVRVINSTTGAEIGIQYSQGKFTDISLSPDERYAYVADFGGENIGYGTPSSPSYVSIYDLQNGTWASYGVSGVAYRVEAMSSNTFLLLSSDQWVTLTANTWGAGGVTINGTKSWSLYYGNIEYSPQTGRVIHGNSGSSSYEINALKWDGSAFVSQEGSGTYGSAQGYGGTVVLSTDGSSFYYGALQVDALNVAFNKHVFPELIYAANANFAFGNGNYYDATSGNLLGTLGITTTIYALDKNSNDFWAFDATTQQLQHYTDNVTIDTDGDGLADALDNCPNVVNQDQKDTDGDKIGDACDPYPLDANNDLAACKIDLDQARELILPDSDNDGEVDANDQCPETLSHSVIDQAGCSQTQFCIRYSGKPSLCSKVDWLNDEPQFILPQDCSYDRSTMTCRTTF